MPEFIRATYTGDNKNDYALKAKIAMDGLEEHPDDAQFIYAYAASFFQMAGQYDECIEYCHKYLPLLTTWQCRHETLETLARAFQLSGNHDKAIEIRKQIVEETKINKPGYEFFGIMNIAEAYEKKEDYANAVAWYEIVAEDDRDETDLEKLATLYEKLKDFDNASKYYIKAAQYKSRESAVYWSNAGRMLGLAGKEDEAKYYFDLALKIDPRDAYTHYYSGVIYQHKGDMYRALHHYTEALKIQPEFPEVYNNLAAISYNEEANIQDTIANIEKALQQNPDNNLLITLYLNLSRLYKKISDYDKHEYYKAKMLEAVGFPVSFEEDDEMDDGEIEDI